MKHFFLVMISCSFLFAGTIGPELQKAMQQERGDFPVMISFKDNVKIGDIIEYYSEISKEEAFSLLKSECETRQAFIKDLCQRMELEGYVRDVNIFWIANAVALKATREAVEELALQPEVDVISLDEVQTMIKPFGSVEGKATPWGLDHIKSRDVNAQGFTGKGVIVAVVDTGIDLDHPAFAPGQILADKCKSFIAEEPTADDGNGHGTHCAGTIGSRDYGVAPDVSLIGVKVLSATGSGSWNSVMQGVEYAAEHADVLSMSLGGRASSSGNVVETAVKNAIANGITVVIAAGNDGPFSQTIGTPGVVSEAITVGAIDESGSIAYFSSRGETVYMEKKPDIVAPGVDVLSAWKNGGTNTISGTSMATPHVAGLVALMLGKSKGLSPEGAKNILMSTTSGTKKPNSYGEGTVQCDRAMSKVGSEFIAAQQIQATNRAESHLKIEGKTDREGNFSITKRIRINPGITINQLYSNASWTDCQLTVNGTEAWKSPQTVKAKVFHPTNVKVAGQTGNFAVIKIEAKNGPKLNAKVKFILRCTTAKVAEVESLAVASRNVVVERGPSTIKIEGKTDREGNLVITKNLEFKTATTILDMYCNASYEDYQVTLNGNSVWETPAEKIDARTFYPIQKSFNPGFVSLKIEGKDGPILNAKVKILFRCMD